MVEVLVSMVLVIIGVVGLLTMLPNSWRLSGRSDVLGKASGVLMNQLHVNEARILNPSSNITAGTVSETVNSSGQPAALAGDTAFTVQTTLTDLGGGLAWMVRVRVTWTGNATGISESMRVVRQQSFTQ